MFYHNIKSGENMESIGAKELKRPKILSASTTTIPPKECLYVKVKYNTTAENFFLLTPIYNDQI